MTENKTSLIVLCLGTYMLTGYVRCKSSPHILKGLAIPQGIGITITSEWFGYDHINMERWQSLVYCTALLTRQPDKGS